jgi:hypothetical protein
VETGIPFTLSSQDAGDIIFNVLDGSAFGLPDGNGLLITGVIGADGATARNPFHHASHAHGGIVHRFHRMAKVIDVEGKVICTTPDYGQQMIDALRTTLLDMLTVKPKGQPGDKAGRWIWTPAGVGSRFHFVHFYTMLDVVPYMTGTAGKSSNAAPKTFTFSVIAERPEALGVVEYATPISVTAAVPNAGNTETWPIFHVTPGGSFDLTRDGYGLHWTANAYAGSGSYIEVDMFHKTLFWDGDGDNAMAGLAGDFGGPSTMDFQDFFAIPAGGVTVTCSASATCYTSDAWVG